MVCPSREGTTISSIDGTPVGERRPQAGNQRTAVPEAPDKDRQARPGPDWRPGDRFQIALLTVAHAVQHFSAAVLAFSYPFVVAYFHVSYAVLGVVLGVTGVIGGLLQGIAGLLRRIPARTLLVGQDIGLAASLLLGALSPVFAVFALAKALGSLVQWPQHPIGSAYLSERVPHRRAFALSWHTIGGSIGTLVVPLIAGFVTARWGWRWSLGVFVPPLLLGAAALWYGMDRDVSTSSVDETALPVVDEGGNAPPVDAADSLGAVLRRPAALAALAAGTVAAAGRGLGVLGAYVPAFLRDGAHLESVLVGVLYTVMLVGSVVGPAAAGWLADRVGRRTVLLVVYPAAALFLVLYVFVGATLWALAVVGLFVGVFAYAESPLIQALFADTTAGAAARSVFGVYFAIAYGVGALWQVIIGWLVSSYGFRTAFIVMAISFVAAGLCVAGAREQPARDRTRAVA